ncbi:MAG: hypothetical protein JWP35_748 [Caulobacter sp.]|nr:hypothetical protein [Caulobacter sp.]
MSADRRGVWFRRTGGLRHEPVSWQGWGFFALTLAVLWGGLAVGVWANWRWSINTFPEILVWFLVVLIGQYAVVVRHAGPRRGA